MQLSFKLLISSASLSVFVCLLFITSSQLVYAENNTIDNTKKPPIFTVIGAFNEDDRRHEYEAKLVELLLEKTRDEFGEYIVQPAPGMTHTRAIEGLSSKAYPNFVRTVGYEESLSTERNLTPIPVPIYRGLIGYRTCFLSKKIKNSFAKVKTREALSDYSFAYGIGWADELVLKHNELEAIGVSDYVSMFKMTAVNRIDLFCRGTHEIYEEYKKFSDIEDLEYDRTKVIYYPLPHFLYTHKSNVMMIKRLTRGLEIVLKDGSFNRLWNLYHKQDIDFVNLKSRQIFKLENPLLEGIDHTYDSYIYQP